MRKFLVVLAIALAVPAGATLSCFRSMMLLNPVQRGESEPSMVRLTSHGLQAIARLSGIESHRFFEAYMLWARTLTRAPTLAEMQAKARELIPAANRARLENIFRNERWNEWMLELAEFGRTEAPRVQEALRTPETWDDVVLRDDAGTHPITFRALMGTESPFWRVAFERFDGEPAPFLRFGVESLNRANPLVFMVHDAMNSGKIVVDGVPLRATAAEIVASILSTHTGTRPIVLASCFGNEGAVMRLLLQRLQETGRAGTVVYAAQGSVQFWVHPDGRRELLAVTGMPDAHTDAPLTNPSTVSWVRHQVHATGAPTTTVLNRAGL